MGHIDVLISGQQPKSQSPELFGNQKHAITDPITNYTFEQLKKKENGTFLDRHYAGSINFIPHSAGSNSSHIHHQPGKAHPKNCGDSKTYLFDITDELKASGIQPTRSTTTPINITFNIDPDHNSGDHLRDITLRQIMIYGTT